MDTGKEIIFHLDQEAPLSYKMQPWKEKIELGLLMLQGQTAQDLIYRLRGKTLLAVNATDAKGESLDIKFDLSAAEFAINTVIKDCSQYSE